MQQISSAVEDSVGNIQSAILPQVEPSPHAKCLKTKELIGMIWAYRLFWFTFILFFGSTALGKLWDRVWHLTHRFDTFWSPPHFFIFAMTTLTSLVVAAIAFTPRLRIWFGPSLRIPLIPFMVPGSLVILGSGLVSLSCTTLFDNFLHRTFGLGETPWSAPHDML